MEGVNVKGEGEGEEGEGEGGGRGNREVQGPGRDEGGQVLELVVALLEEARNLLWVLLVLILSEPGAILGRVLLAVLA